MVYVEAGLKNDPIWGELNNQIYLGDAKFVDKMKAYLAIQATDIQVPIVQRRSVAKSLDYYEKQALSRDEGIIAAYSSGGYSYQELGGYFKLYFTTIGKIIRRQRQ